MRKSVKRAIGETLQGFVDCGIKTSFTEKELKMFRVTIPEAGIKGKSGPKKKIKE